MLLSRTQVIIISERRGCVLTYPELENYLSPFMDAWQGGAQDLLQGHIAFVKIPLSRMISPLLY